MFSLSVGFGVVHRCQADVGPQLLKEYGSQLGHKVGSPIGQDVHSAETPTGTAPSNQWHHSSNGVLTTSRLRFPMSLLRSVLDSFQ